MSDSLFYKATPFPSFNDFLAEWSRIVTQNCLPLIQQQLPSAATASELATNIKTVLGSLEWYYGELDSFANNDPKIIPYLLFPSWRNSLEMPILFLGDINPYLLASLFRCITNRENQDSYDELLKIIENVVGDRLSVLLNQMREAQMRFAARFSVNWVSTYHSQEGRQRQTAMETEASVAVVDEAAKEDMKEFARIFVDANHLRTEAIKQIVASTDDHLAALFLEALFGIFAGFKDQEWERGNEFMNMKDENSIMNKMIEEHKNMVMNQNKRTETLQSSIINLRNECTKLKDENSTNNKVIEEKNIALERKEADLEEKNKALDDVNQRFAEQNVVLGGLPADSPLQMMVDRLPLWFRSIVAPKGGITGAELGTMMGSLVALVPYVVTVGNRKMKITFWGGLINLVGMVIGTMFNNIVTHFSTAQHARFIPTLGQAATSVPWVLFGGLIPLVIGGFIHAWGIRAIVTGGVALLLKMLFAYMWTSIYKIPKMQGVFIVLTAVIGIGLAAGAPLLIQLVGKKI